MIEACEVGGVRQPEWLRPISQGGRAILNLLLKRGGLSQAAVTANLDLSQPSVARLIGGFHSDGLVRISDRAAEGRGNPSVQVTLNPDFAYSLGISIAGDALSATILDLAGNIRATAAVSMPDMSRPVAIKALQVLKAKVLAQAKIAPDRVVGAGVGFSGFFVGPPVRFNPPALLTDWAQVDVAETLSGPLGLSVICDNDGTAAAVAEGLLGIGRRCSTFAYCFLTNGFGGGLIVNGQPMRGALGNAGDFGGVLWLLDEGYPSLERLRTHAAQAGQPYETVETMVRAIDPETPGVGAWIAEAQRPIAKLAFLLGHIVAPEMVVIGGRLPHSVAQALAAQIVLPQTPSRNGVNFPLPKVVASEVEGDAVAIGAAAMVLQKLFFA